MCNMLTLGGGKEKEKKGHSLSKCDPVLFLAKLCKFKSALRSRCAVQALNVERKKKRSAGRNGHIFVVYCTTEQNP